MTRSEPRRPDSEALSRRSFLKGAGGVAAAGSALARELEAARLEQAAEDGKVLEGSLTVRLRVNGEEREVALEPRTTLLSALRDRMGLTGTKLVCDQGSCGACTVTIDGRPTYSCLQLAVLQQGRDIRTIEGVAAADGSPSALQLAFCEHDASMCGFCTPGFVMALSAELARNPAADERSLRRACSGNLCRCGTYPHVFEAALATARGAAGGKPEGGR